MLVTVGSRLSNWQTHCSIELRISLQFDVSLFDTMISSRILTQCVVRLQACSTAGLRIADCSQNVLARSHALPSAISESSRNGDVLSVSSGFEPLLTQVRHRNIRRRIMGHPRPPIFGKITPEPNKYRYTPVLPKVS